MTNSEPNRLDQLEYTQQLHGQILHQLAESNRQLAEFSTRQAERQQQTLDTLTQQSERQQQTLDILTRQSERQQQELNRHDEALARIEEQQQRTAAQAERTERALEALSQTQVECLQLIAQNTIEINRIWQHLERRFNNGNGRSEQ